MAKQNRGLQLVKTRSDFYHLLSKESVCAEVGVAEGLYSLEICKWGVKHLYMIDIWEPSYFPGDAGSPKEWHDKNYAEAVERVKDYPVTILKGTSELMSTGIPDNSLDFVHLDACHSYKEVLKDLGIWIHKLKKGGIMTGHDYLNNDYGVNQAVTEFCKDRYKVHTIDGDRTIHACFLFFK